MESPFCVPWAPAMKHLSKFTRKDTNFEGWRLSVRRAGEKFVRYFSALELGGMEQAEAAARAMRDALLADLDRHPDKVADMMARYRKPACEYPAGLQRPQPVRGQELPKGCYLRYTPAAAELLETASRQWELSQASMMRVALYMFLDWSRKEGKGLKVHDLVRFLDSLASEGFPTFSEFSSFSSPAVIQSDTKETRIRRKPLEIPPSEPRRGYVRLSFAVCYIMVDKGVTFSYDGKKAELQDKMR